MKLTKHLRLYLLPFVAIVATPFLWKIDKVSFFHHFIRITQEVETRNSQAIGEGTGLVEIHAFVEQDQVPGSGMLPISAWALAGHPDLQLPKPTDGPAAPPQSADPANPVRAP